GERSRRPSSRRAPATQRAPGAASGGGPRDLRRQRIPRRRDGRDRRPRGRLETGPVPALPREDGALPGAAGPVLRERRGRRAPGAGLDRGQQGTRGRHGGGVLHLRGRRASRLPAGVRERPHQRAPGTRAGRACHRAHVRSGRRSHRGRHRAASRRGAVARGEPGGHGAGERPLLAVRRRAAGQGGGCGAGVRLGLARHPRLPAHRRTPGL
ncbi:MAG: Transcriptional regulator, AcrR family, partial [uncultured Nocardioidaceae bacterium]